MSLTGVVGVGLVRALPNPTAEDLADPLFNRLWDLMRKWDIELADGDGRCAANGSHVMLVLNAVREELQLELAIIGAWRLEMAKAVGKPPQG